MVFKLASIKKVLQTNTAQIEAEKRPFDVAAQLAFIESSVDNKEQNLTPQDRRQKRSAILHCVALPHDILAKWIQEEISSENPDLHFVESIAKLLVGSSLGLEADKYILQVIAQEQQQQEEFELKLENDDETVPTTNEAEIINQKKVVLVAGKKLSDAFDDARKRHGNSFLENHKLFDLWRDLLETHKATEDNGDELDEVIRESYTKLQFVIPSDRILNVLESYKEWELDELDRDLFVAKAEKRLGLDLPDDNDQQQQQQQQQNNNNSKNSNNSDGSKLRLLNNLRRKNELALVEAKSGKELYKAVRNYAEIERKKENQNVNPFWFERSVYQLMSGIMSCEARLSESAANSDFVESGFDLIQELLRVVSKFLVDSKISDSETVSQNSLMLRFPELALWISRHFELLFYYAVKYSASDEIAKNEVKSNWARRRLRLLESCCKFLVFTSPTEPQSRQRISDFSNIVTIFAIEEKEAANFVASKVALLMSLHLISFNKDLVFKANDLCESCLIRDDATLEDHETALLIPLLYQHVLCVDKGRQPSPSSNITKSVTKLLETAQMYFNESRRPLQSFTLVLTAMSRVAETDQADVVVRNSPGIKHLSIQLVAKFEEYRNASLAEDLKREDHHHQQQQQVKVEQDDRRREREQEERLQTNNSAISPSSNIKKFYIKHLPKEKEKTLEDAVKSCFNGLISPISIDFIRPSRQGASAATTLTAILSLKEEDLNIVLAQQAEGVLTTKLQSFYPGIIVEAENSSSSQQHQSSSSRRPAPLIAVSNNDGNPPTVMTNDDFLKMLG